MSETHVEEQAAEAPKPKKRKKADMDWLNDAGEVVKDIAEAVGFRHVVLSSGTAHDVAFADVDENIRRMLMAHGLKQKSTDTASGARANDNDEDEAVASLFDDFKEGKWRGDRGESVAGVKALAEALAELKGSDNVEGYFEFVRDLDEEARKGLRKNVNIQAVIVRKRAERLAEKARTGEDGDDAIAAIATL